ncbi:MAG: hypothetical protein R6W77_12245 [Trueperaceae bacterium]
MDTVRRRGRADVDLERRAGPSLDLPFDLPFDLPLASGDVLHPTSRTAWYILGRVDAPSTSSRLRPRARTRFALASILTGWALVTASAAGGIPPYSTRGIMVQQAVEVLGGTVVGCDALFAAGVLEPPGGPRTTVAEVQTAAAPPSPALSAAPGELTCARIPTGMYRHVRVAVRGRLYEYLRRGTLLALSDWDRSREDRRVDYVVDRGVLRIERHQLDGVSYVTFWFRLPTDGN